MTSFLSLTAYSRTNIKPTSTKAATELNAMSENGWAVTADNIARAHCVRRKPFTVEEMTSWLDFYAEQGAPAIPEAQVNGVRFADERPALIQLFRDLVTYTGYKRFGANNLSSSVDPSCTRVLCAVNAVFGSKIGLKLLYMLGRFRTNGSHLAFDASPWRSNELDEVLLGFAAYPDFMNERFSNDPFIHHLRDVDNGVTVANAQGLFSEWNQLSPPERYIAITHERAHRFNRPQTPDLNKIDTTTEWYRLSGWRTEDLNSSAVDTGPFHLAHPEWVPSTYGRSKPREDFAESITKYRFDPVGFLQILGEGGRPKYEFIRDVVFHGIEFKSEQECSGSFQFGSLLK